MKLIHMVRIPAAGLLMLAAAVSPAALPLPMDGAGTGTVIEGGWTVGERAAIELEYMHTISGSFKADWRAVVPATSDREEFSPSLSFGLGGIPAWHAGAAELTLPAWGDFGLSATPYADLPWGGGFLGAGLAPGIGNRFGRLGLLAAVRLPVYRFEEGSGASLVEGLGPAAERAEIDLRLTLHSSSGKRFRWLLWGGVLRPADWSLAGEPGGLDWAVRGGAALALGF